MRLRPLLVATTIACAAVVLPGAAGAATVGLVHEQTLPATSANRYYPASPPTDVYVLRVADPDGALDGTGRLRDTAVPLTPGPGCATGADGCVTCTPAPTAPGNGTQVHLALDTGAGNDRATIAAGGGGALLDLGPGDDRVVVTGGGWTVRGGDGADAIQDDGPTSRASWDGGPGPDRASGPGVDVTYAGRTTGVHVTPDDVADDGAPGEGDDVGTDVGMITGGDGPDVLQAANGLVDGGAGDDTILGAVTRRAPQLQGGDGDDTILGGAADERLDGGPGDDRLDGGAGNDILDGGPGADQVDGGAGDDGVGYYADGAPDVYRGGPGRDQLSAPYNVQPIAISLDGVADDGPAGEHDRVAPDWETVGIGTGRLVGTDGPDILSIGVKGSADGRGGDDELFGYGTLTGGPGHDTITTDVDQQLHRPHPLVTVDARDGAGGDRLFCDARVVRVRRDRGDHAVGCAGHPEVTLAPASPWPLVLRDGGSTALALRCFGGQSCRGRLWLRAGPAGSRPVGSTTLTAPLSVRHTVVHVARRGRAACGTLRATVRLRDRAGRRFVQDVKLGPCTWAK